MKSKPKSARAGRGLPGAVPAPTYFSTAAEFSAWLETHHATAAELLVGFHKRGSGIPSLTWPESVDAALCFGWIDGVRRRIDDLRYSIRFTPRKASSTWSAVNIARMEALAAAGLVRPAGSAAFARRTSKRSRIYGYEQASVGFDAPVSVLFETNPVACAFFLAQPPGYRKIATWWVMSAKREETRLRRARRLIELSALEKRLDFMKLNA